MTPDLLETKAIRLNQHEFITFLMDIGLLKKEKRCSICSYPMNFVLYKRSIDQYSWRCMTKTCRDYKKYMSIRNNSFFEQFRIDIKDNLKV